MDELSRRIAQLSPEKKRLFESQLLERESFNTSTTQITPRETASTYSPSFAQQRFWFLQQLEPDTPVYNMPAAFRLRGDLHIEALRQAFEAVIERHDTLRTVFKIVDGETQAVILEHYAFELPVIVLPQRSSEAEQAIEAQQLMIRECQRPFDLNRDLMVRGRVFQLNDSDYCLLLVVHHIAIDYWSGEILYKELETFYGSFACGRPVSLPEFPLRYSDFAFLQKEWLQSRSAEKQLSYWLEQLGGELPSLHLPVDRPRSAAQTRSGARQTILLPAELIQPLETLGRQKQTTLFAVMLAAFQALLFFHNGQENISVGSPVAGRRRVESENLIGNFINTLALRTDLSGDPTFRELLGRVRMTVSRAYANQDIPFEYLLKYLQSPKDISRFPVLQVMLIFLNVPETNLRLSDLAVEQLRVDNESTAQALSFYVYKNGKGKKLIAEYNADLFKAKTIQCLLENFQTVLEGIAANPNQPISNLLEIADIRQAPLAVSHMEESGGVRQVTGPRNSLERRITEIVKRILGLRQVGIEENLFDLGGHSLFAGKLLFEIEKTLTIHLPMTIIFQAPTIEGLAVKIRQIQETGSFPALPPILAKGKLPTPPAIRFLQNMLLQPNVIPSPFLQFKDYWALKPLTHFKALLLSPVLSFTERFQGFRKTLALLLQLGVFPGMPGFSYTFVSQWISWCSRQTCLQKRLFPHQETLLRQVSELNQCSLHGDPKMLSRSINSHLWPFWKMMSLINRSPAQCERWISTKGLSSLHANLQKKQGIVIVLSHLALGMFVPYSLERAGIKRALSIGTYTDHFTFWKCYQSARQRQADLDASVDVLLGAQVSVAEQLLAQGGVVCIAGDGYQGQMMPAVPFCGRLRRFGTGFSELALSTGSAVIPAWSFMDAAGKIHVRFEKPLQTTGETHQEQVESLLFQYVDSLKNIWKEHIEEIDWGHLEKFLALPTVTYDTTLSFDETEAGLEPDTMLYGLEQDHWIGRESRLRLRPRGGVKHLTLRVEAHAPQHLYPLTMNFEGSHHHIAHTHTIEKAGPSEILLDLPRVLAGHGNGELKIVCDKTFVPQQVNPQSSDTRELGVRLVALHYS